jgi:hypothetical protein
VRVSTLSIAIAAKIPLRSCASFHEARISSLASRWDRRHSLRVSAFWMPRLKTLFSNGTRVIDDVGHIYPFNAVIIAATQVFP